MENFTFDVANFLIGMLVGVVVAFLLKLNSLKTLGLKLDKIGLDLGVEGFEKESTGNAVSVNAGGNVGDVAGGNIDKSINNSKFYQNLKQVLAAGNQNRTKIVRPERTRIISEDPMFGERLDKISRQNDDWFETYIGECLSNLSFKSQIARKIQEIESNGWHVETMNFDNVPGGLHINFEVSRIFQK